MSSMLSKSSGKSSAKSFALKLVAIGNSTGVILPKEILARMRVDRGDTLAVVESPDGIMLRIVNPEFETQMAVARDVMKRRRVALGELAK